MDGGQNLKQRNGERPIFRNFKIANIKITKGDLFDSFIFEFNFLVRVKISNGKISEWLIFRI